MPESLHIAHLLLAAGASTRMGQPKQLLPWKGKSLIRHTVQQIQDAGIANKIIVVLGAHNELITPELQGSEIEQVYNPDWAEGMASTIRCGMQYVAEERTMEWNAVCISLVDQPFIQARHFQLLFEQWQQHARPITAAQYENILGVPAIFDRSQFPALLALQGQMGARKMLQLAKDLVWPVELPEAQFDLDTPDDYEKLIRQK